MALGRRRQPLQGVVRQGYGFMVLVQVLDLGLQLLLTSGGQLDGSHVQRRKGDFGWGVEEA